MPQRTKKDKLRNKKTKILTDWKTKHETLTKAICKKGFGGNSNILPRIKIRVDRQESSPQSLSAHSLNR